MYNSGIQIRKKDQYALKYIILLIIIIIIYILSMSYFFKISFEIILHFLALNIISIFLPGLAIIEILHINCSKITLVLYSYAIGYAFIILEYFFAEIFNRKISFGTITFSVAIVSATCLIRKIIQNEKSSEYKKGNNTWIDIVFFIIFLLLSVLAYSANYLSPDMCVEFTAARDMQFWVNNTVALKISFPPSNLYMHGNLLNYHYFSNIPIAFLSSVYRIDIFTLSFPLYCITKAFLMIGAVHFLLNTIGADKRMKIAAYVLMLFTTGAENIVFVTFLHHTLLSPFGFDISYAYGIYFVALMIQQWKKETFELNCLAQLILIWSMCVGSKGPVGTVLLLLPALLCLYWLVKEQWALAFGYGVVILALYLFICKYCIGMFSVIDGTSAWHLSGIYTSNDLCSFPATDNKILSLVVELGKKNIIFAIIVKCFLLNPSIMWFGCLSLIGIYLLFRKAFIESHSLYLDFSLAATAVWGLFLWMIVNAGGHSEMYFGMTAMIPLSILIFVSYVQIKGNFDKLVIAKSGIRHCMRVIGIVLMLCCMYFYFLSSYAGVGAVYSVQEGMNKLNNINENAHRDSGQDSIRKSDAEALEWLRDNTPLDSLILSDKAVITDNPHYYLYGMFCERQQYLEGSDMLALAGEKTQSEIQRRKNLITDIYSNKGGIQKVREEGVDYIVQTKDITPGFIYDPDELILVTSTETMNIYQVRNSTGGE